MWHMNTTLEERKYLHKENEEEDSNIQLRETKSIKFANIWEAQGKRRNMRGNQIIMKSKMAINRAIVESTLTYKLYCWQLSVTNKKE